jgi:opacity protein-like surface antigen
MNTHFLNSLGATADSKGQPMKLQALFAAAALVAAALSPATAAAQTPFPSAEAAGNALIEAIATNDSDAKRAILGADYQRFIPPESVDADDRTAFLFASSKGRRIIADGPELAHLSVGAEGWTLPIPIKKTAQGWRFDVKAGVEEMRIRRIGRNELAAMQALLAFYDAQKEYASADRNGDGLVEYAQRFRSTAGKRDGLIWTNDPASPLGPLYGDETKDGVYHGYRFRILKAQGPDARGGARDFVVKGRMTQGFAAVAWPAKWNDSGVMTFIVSHDGNVYQKNLGAGTDAAARAMTRFNPDQSWTQVPDAQLAVK